MVNKVSIWPVVPLSEGQLLDVRPEDVLNDGLYRKCDTYRGGGGYDQFPIICERRLGKRLHRQFVVQLRGCNLDCPYCYVTRAGVWGQPVKVMTNHLVEDFIASGQDVFHLMGGAPALHMRKWPELIKRLPKNTVFHSDIMLSESDYDPNTLREISQPNCLYAIDIKGLTSQDWLQNTRKPLNEDRFWRNWRLLQEHHVPSYVTFTGVTHSAVDDFWHKAQKNGIDRSTFEPDSFIIDLIDYEATRHVDDVRWGWNGQ